MSEHRTGRARIRREALHPRVRPPRLVREDGRRRRDRVPGAKTPDLGGIPAGGRATAHRRSPPASSSTTSTAPTSRARRRPAATCSRCPSRSAARTSSTSSTASSFGEKIEEFDPDFSKVLVRYNPEGDAEMNERQTARLRRLSEWLHEHHRKFLFELLVPAEPAQLEQVGGSDGALRHRASPGADDGGDPAAPERRRRAGHLEDRGDRRPRGVHARSRSSCRAKAATACRASCSAAAPPTTKVDEWLRAGAGLTGYIGFAIGRSIFGEAVKAYAADPDGFDRDAAVGEIAGELPALHRGLRGRARARVGIRLRRARRLRLPPPSPVPHRARLPPVFVDGLGVRRIPTSRTDKTPTAANLARARMCDTRV